MPSRIFYIMPLLTTTQWPCITQITQGMRLLSSVVTWIFIPGPRTWLNSSLQPEGVGPGPDLTDVMVDSYVPDLENRGELAF